MQLTSLEAYTRIKNEGLLSSLRFLVYQDIFEHQGTTAGEVASRLSKIGVRQNSVSSRFAELEEMGLIIACVPRDCQVTGYKVLTYQLTGNLPKPLPKKESSKEKIRKLEKEIEELKAELEHTRSLVPIQSLLPLL